MTGVDNAPVSQNPNGESPNKETQTGPSRRGIVAAVAWSVPVIALASATPARATSAGSTFTLDVVQVSVPRGQSSEVIARVLDSTGQPWAGQPVSLTVTDSTGITFALASGTTDGAGEFRTTLNTAATTVAGLRTVTATSDGFTATDTFTVGMTNVVGAGNNNIGRLGDGTTTNRPTPILLSPVFPSPVKQIAHRATTVGQGSTFFLLEDGTVWSVGLASTLGDGSTANRSTPAAIPGLSGVTQIAAGGSSAYALLSTGQVRAWGAGTNGQLGNGTTTNSPTPVTVLAPGGGAALTGVTRVVAGGGSVLALTTAGTVVVWGIGTTGQLGNGTTTATQSTPIVVPGLSGVTSVGAGQVTNFAVLSSGEARVWGGSGGSTYSTDQLTPVVLKGIGGVGALTNIREIAGGYTGALALLTSGEVRAWGPDNSNGYLGDNTSTTSTTPVVVQVPGGAALSGVTQLTSGAYSGQALLSSGQVVTWGLDNSGQQGAGTTGVSRYAAGPYTLPAGRTAKAIGWNGGGYTISHFAILND